MFLSLLLVITWGIVAPVQSQGPSADEVAIRDVFKRMAEFFTQCDPKAIANLFAPDGDRYSGGKYARGRAEVEKMYEGVCSLTKGGKNRFDISVRFLRPDVALIDGTWFNDSTGTSAGLTVITTKEAGQWLIAAGRPR